jgi:hypothetical protein
MLPSSSSIVMHVARTSGELALGTLDVTVDPSIFTSTPDGTGMGCLPIRDTASLLSFSPRPLPDVGDDFAADASLAGRRSVMTPCDVEMMAMPRPPRTRGSSSFFAYTRRPGLLMRRIPVIVRSLRGPYFSVISSSSCGFASMTAVVNDVTLSPSECLAISTSFFDDGIVVVALYAEFALRMRVSISAMGSVMLISVLLWFGMIRSAVRARPVASAPLRAGLLRA